MKIAAAALVLSTLITPLFAADAAPQTMLRDAGDVAIAALGEINGIALACNQLAIASRARNAITTTAHKSRANGEIFENTTSAAFLAQGKDQTCPDTATLVKRLSEGEKNLSAAFTPK